MRYGVLLPHFGAHCRPDRIVGAAQRCEELGFDSVWVRDHLLWRPHGMEGTDITFVEPIVSLAAIASVTRRLVLGTAVLIPVRWPLKLAQNLASLSYLAGGRVVAGIGLGSNPKELAAVGLDLSRREEIFVETVQILRRVWAGNGVSFQGQVFSFSDVSIEPKPVEPIPIWYGGATRASVRRAVAWCDGWLPGRIPMATLDDRLRLLRSLSEQQGKRVSVGVIPVVSVARTREEAVSRVDIRALTESSEASKTWIVPPGGFRTVEDLEGLLVCGTPRECVDQIRAFEERGVELFVFDLRLQFDRFEESLELIGQEVLPRLRG